MAHQLSGCPQMTYQDGEDGEAPPVCCNFSAHLVAQSVPAPEKGRRAAAWGACRASMATHSRSSQHARQAGGPPASRKACGRTLHACVTASSGAHSSLRADYCDSEHFTDPDGPHCCSAKLGTKLSRLDRWLPSVHQTSPSTTTPFQYWDKAIRWSAPCGQHAPTGSECPSLHVQALARRPGCTLLPAPLGPMLHAPGERC